MSQQQYINELITQNETGLALLYLSRFGYDIQALLNQYNFTNERLYQGKIDIEEFYRITAEIKLKTINLAFDRPPSFDITVIIKTPIVVISSRSDAREAIAVRQAIQELGYYTTITDARCIQKINLSSYRLVYIITENYFLMKTDWPIFYTNNITKVSAISFNNKYNYTIHNSRMNRITAKLFKITESIQNSINSGHPVAALVKLLLRTEQAKNDTDNDFKFILHNGSIDGSHTPFIDVIQSALKSVK